MDEFLGHIEPTVFEAGEILFRENEESYHFYIIQKGKVEVYKYSAGAKIPLATVGEGASIGEFAMIDQKPRSATAVALTRVEAVKVSEEVYGQLIEQLPDWAVSVMRSLVERIRNANEIVKRIAVDEKTRKILDSSEYES
jgi:CRP-like cAMP-binding protein